ncbi:MAG: cardiolipin synthase [Erysipelotrichaceae bacterium]|nr:cardiolipin synthase [Solobacterium sp.]MDD7776103.1 cardiolipin synthase [Solobacterium sp.]MDY2952774.1 cardiolipin synthase [Erysipelotrichaceae bacterium]MDY5401248.1 cardiolipin synthase [Erysipelotrichaceae bacterium]
MKSVLGRIITLVFMVLGELALGVLLFNYLTSKFVFIEVFLHILAVIVVLNIIRTSKHLSSDITWIFLIILFPVPATFVFLLTYFNLFINRTFKSIVKEENQAVTFLNQDDEALEDLKKECPTYYQDFMFLKNSNFPIYYNNNFDYYSPGEKGFPVLLSELKKAKKYIFMEYFIIEEGIMFNSILDILKEKVKEGVECRVMYDDMGSLHTLPKSYANILESYGIKAVTFNKVTPILSTIMNNRDHRKILIIDGKVAFSGGVNLADEYINKKVVHGKWLDNIIRIKGKAVDSMLVTFLTNWNALRHEDEDYRNFMVEHREKVKDGFIVPYSETPLDFELTAQSVYMDILNRAQDYVYIMTPYLIIDEEMINCLIHTAKKGVDVKIIVPGVADKKIIHDIGESYYDQLIKDGVKIYEYRPGFVHAKVFVSDDISSVVGTINLDYRSLYLHFENAVLLYKSKKIMDIKKDFLNALEDSVEIKHARFSLVKNFLMSVLRIFASLL